MDKSHRYYSVLAYPESFKDFRIVNILFVLELLSLKIQQGRDYLQVILYPVVNFLFTCNLDICEGFFCFNALSNVSDNS
ncbi:hypothetical protein [Methanosarcina horonobensis]|uniref:hypothetical protein n=1 Tax=Methanosarcina horonobensis TaxID=418008 RepID=UPI0022B8C16A|nr:hypothetical protein [Methanosarcina horonobensis]